MVSITAVKFTEKTTPHFTPICINKMFDLDFQVSNHFKSLMKFHYLVL